MQNTMKEFTFKDAQYMSAKDKGLVLRAWELFLKNGLKFEHFTDRLYKHLTLHCSLIAHCHKSGFYATYFENSEDAVRFFSQFDRAKGFASIEYGGTSWFYNVEYEDLNNAMVEVYERYKDDINKSLMQSARTQCLSELQSMKTKAASFGITLICEEVR